MDKTLNFYKTGDSVTLDIHDTIVISWSMENIGFGEFVFYKDEEEKLCCHSEMMGQKFIKNLLNELVDKAKFVDLED